MKSSDGSNELPWPDFERMPRVSRDIRDCLGFIARQPWGNPADCERDIYLGLYQIRRDPLRNKVGAVRLATGRELRRHDIRQFAIIYIYLEPNAVYPRGLVSIRAVRHRRVANVFASVRETTPPTTDLDPSMLISA